MPNESVEHVPGGWSRELFAGTSYRALRRLGSGAMGEAFLVEHEQIGRRFVAKVMRSELANRPQLMDRMRLEAQALGRLNHPNIVSVTDTGITAEHRPFFVMEYLRGRTLREELEVRGALPLLEALHRASELLGALSAAHSLGIVHRDVKPGNLFLAQRAGGSEHVLKVLDFGIAKVLPDAPSWAPSPLATSTETGTLVGTPRYASPEAAAGLLVDARADLYGAGLVLYCMLAGRGPFDHLEGERAVLQAQRSERPLPPSALARVPLPAELDDIVLKVLAKDPGERFQSAGAFASALQQVGTLLERSPGWLKTIRFDRTALFASPASRAAGPDSHECSDRSLPAVPARGRSSPEEAGAAALGGASQATSSSTSLSFRSAIAANPRALLVVFVAVALTTSAFVVWLWVVFRGPR